MNEQNKKITTCNFCEDILKKNRLLGLPAKESILYEDENIYVMPDISPLAIGHLLIISKKHFQSFASANAETMESLKKFLRYYKKRIGNRNFSIFEHGAVIPYHAGASIDHAHMHILPYVLDIKQKLTNTFGYPQKYDLTQISILKEKKQSYFYCMVNNENLGVIFEVQKVPSQFLRKIVNELLMNNDSYDWKQNYQTPESQLLFYKTFAWWKSLDLKNTFKWNKKILLEKYGLSDYRRLIYEIHRFKKDEANMVRLLLEKELKLNKKINMIYRVILVPTRHQYNLPNYIIECEKDLDGLDDFYRNNNFDEIWYMSNRIENNGQFSGRLSISNQGLLSEIVLEIIVGDNLRKLEKYSIGKEDSNYFRAIKKPGETCFIIEENNMHNLNTEVFIALECIKKEIAKYNNNINLLCESLQKHGIRVISFDFRIEHSKLVFLDWDTAEDEKVLKYQLG